jgi:hypothetical protein
MSQIADADHLVLDQPIVLRAGSQELLPLLSWNQRCSLFAEVVRALLEGRRPTIALAGEISPVDLLRGYLNAPDRCDLTAKASASLANL